MWMSKSVIAVMKDGGFGNYMCLVHLCVGVHPSRCPSFHADHTNSNYNFCCSDTS